MPRIKLKMGAREVEPRSQRLTLRTAGQTSETPSKDEGVPSGVTVDKESLKRQQELVRTGSASQDADTHRMSPRNRSLRRHLASPSRSSVATTPSISEQPQNGPAAAKELAGVIKSESSGLASQLPETARPLNGLHGVPSEPHDSKACSRTGNSPHLMIVTDSLLHHTAPVPQPVATSPLDSLLRRPGQGKIIFPPYSFSDCQHPRRQERTRK
jgi:hypothetical protein